MNLRKFNVTVARFDPRADLSSAERFVLPVDSPDAEHAVSAAMSNAVAFTSKVDGGRPKPIAFCCVDVSER